MPTNCRTNSRLALFSQSPKRSSLEHNEYDGAFERAFDALQRCQSALEEEHVKASALADHLALLDSGSRQLLLKNSGRAQTWSLLKILIKTGKEETFTNPDRAEDILQEVLTISERLSPTSLAPGVVDDIRARIWGFIANARRVQVKIEASEDAFKEAFRYLERGTGDPMEMAVLLDLRASLLRVQQRFEESIQLLRRTHNTFSRFGETNRAGSSLINASVAYRYKGEVGKAIELLYQALSCIDQACEPRLGLYALHNLADDLAEAGRFLEARKVLKLAYPLYKLCPHSSVQSRRRWVEAKIAFGLGYPDAEGLLRDAQDSFISSNKSYDTNLISVDLASLRAKRGRS
jgi:tetratricopeptide (TPR) repeat protein